MKQPKLAKAAPRSSPAPSRPAPPNHKATAPERLQKPAPPPNRSSAPATRSAPPDALQRKGLKNLKAQKGLLKRPGKPGATDGNHRRRALEIHVIDVQRKIRSCAGCGLCCTETYNAIKILPVEAGRIAGWIRQQPPEVQKDLGARLLAAVKKYRLKQDAPVRYTCSFLEADMRCALPLHVKPVACLSFNPLTRDSCDQEAQWYHRVHPIEERRNREQGLPAKLQSIPLAVLDALEKKPKKKV